MCFDIPEELSPERLKDDIRHLREWLSKQPHLPEVDEDWLETFLCRSDFSLEKTKLKLDTYYSMRTKYPELLKNRDPTSSDLIRCRKAVRLGLSDRLTSDNARIFFCKYEEDARVFEMEPLSKLLFMVLDAMLLNKENRQAYLVFVVDFQDITYLHMLKVLSGVMKAAEIFSEAYSDRIKAIHVINFPSFAARFIDIIKSHFPQRIADMFYLHEPMKSTLFETVDEDIVCTDFGGEGPSLDYLVDELQKDLEKHREWFKEQDKVCSNELLRRADDGTLELRGSFRKLEVD